MSKMDEYFDSFVNRSSATERLHRKVLTQYDRFVHHDEQLYSVHTTQMFLEKCKRRGMENISVATYTAVMRSFLRFIGIPDRERDAIRAPRVGFKVKSTIDENNWEIFLKQPKTLKGMSIVYVTLYGACRVGELRRIKVGDINWKDEMIIIKGMRDAKIRGPIQINRDTIEVLREYIKEQKLTKEDRLFDLTERRIEQLIKKWAIAAGIPNAEKITPHSLRRSLGKAFYIKSGKDIEKTRIILGHQNISSTQHYLGIQEEEVRKDYKKMFG